MQLSDLLFFPGTVSLSTIRGPQKYGTVKPVGAAAYLGYVSIPLQQADWLLDFTGKIHKVAIAVNIHLYSAAHSFVPRRSHGWLIGIIRGAI